MECIYILNNVHTFQNGSAMFPGHENCSPSSNALLAEKGQQTYEVHKKIN